MSFDPTTNGHLAQHLDLGRTFVDALANGVPLTDCCLAPVDQSSPDDPVCTVCGKHFCLLA